MTQHDNGGPSPQSFEPKAGRNISPGDEPTAAARRDREGGTGADAEASETESPKADAEEAIDRATASLGDDDGKR